LFWQSALAVVLGVLTGLLIVGLTHKRAAAALTTSSLSLPPPAGNFGIQVLPTLNERMTVLVMGVDSNGRNTERFTGCRSDTMILASLDPQTHKVGLISIPRDSRVKIAGNHGMDKINSAHAFGGPQLAVATVGENFLVPVDHYIVVDTEGLKQLCELLGPVEVLVEKEMHYHDWSAHLHIDLKPGLQVLDPGQVEQYVRFRHDARGDIGRIERQQWFFRAAANKMKDPQFLLRLPELVKLAHDYVQTDLSIEDMARIATFAKDVHQENVVTATLPGEAQTLDGISYWLPDFDNSRAVFNRVLGIGSGGALVQEGSTNISTSTNTSTSDENLTVDSSAYSRPLSFAIKYAKGSDEQANNLEQSLINAGYRVRYKWLSPVSDCQHKQIVQMSARSDDSQTDKLKAGLPCLSTWPVSLAIEAHPVADFTIIVSPDASIPLPVAGPPQPGSTAQAIPPTPVTHAGGLSPAVR
jgi:LCP family protein required for cell wall assembly